MGNLSRNILPKRGLNVIHVFAQIVEIFVLYLAVATHIYEIRVVGTLYILARYADVGLFYFDMVSLSQLIQRLFQCYGNILNIGQFAESNAFHRFYHHVFHVQLPLCVHYSHGGYQVAASQIYGSYVTVVFHHYIYLFCYFVQTIWLSYFRFRYPPVCHPSQL